MTNGPSDHVIGTFRDPESARRARDRLVKAGFAADSVDVVENVDPVPIGSSDPDAPRVDYDDAETTAEAMGGPIRPAPGFWSRLLGFRRGRDEPAAAAAKTEEPRDEGQAYFSAVFERGDHLVIVAASGRVDEVAALLREAGAQVEPRAGAWLDQRFAADEESGENETPPEREPPLA